jgi:hypothetical protein
LSYTDFSRLLLTRARDRLKTWRSLRILDTFVSLFLGRPSATSNNTSELAPDTENPTETSRLRDLALNATYQLLTPMDTITNDAYRRLDAGTASAKALLENLTAWSTTLDPKLRSTSADPSFDRLNQELILGNMHVSCAYYFAVILTTRPYLMRALLSSTLTSRQATGGDSLPPSSNAPSEDPDTAVLISTCEDAAMLMLDSCRDILDADIMLSNMCLLQSDYASFPWD